jgi:hypothetical protein
LVKERAAYAYKQKKSPASGSLKSSVTGKPKNINPFSLYLYKHTLLKTGGLGMNEKNMK